MDQVRKLLSVTQDTDRVVRDSCRKHLTTIFTNIISNPSELKYRKIREENQILKKELFGFENATDILEIAGFDRTGAKSANGASWVFMAPPEDTEAMNVLQGILNVLIDDKNQIKDDIRVQEIKDDDEDNNNNNSSAIQHHHVSNNNNNTNNSEYVPPELLAAARQAFGQPQQQQPSNNTNTHQVQQQQTQQDASSSATTAAAQPPQKFFSFARSMGFQMRMEALQEAQKQEKEKNNNNQKNEDAAAEERSSLSSPLESFLAEQLLDTRNSDAISETIRIIRVLIENMRREPDSAKYRLLKFDNNLLSKVFFPVHGAPELFIGLLGFSMSDEGLAKEIVKNRSDDEEKESFEKVASILKKVEEGLEVRRDLENQERRRLAKELLKDDIEEERKRQGLVTAKQRQQQREKAEEDAKKPKKKIPISEAINYLMGKVEED